MPSIAGSTEKLLTSDVRIAYKQQLFIDSMTRGNLFLGGIRSGKTFVLCYKAICKAWNGQRGCIVSFSYRTLSDVVLYTLKQCFNNFQLVQDRDYHFKDGGMTIIINGTELLLRTGDDPEKLRGLSLNWFGLDEAREFPDNTVFLVLIGRLSLGIDQQWFITTTTKGKNWFYDIVKNADLLSAFDPPGYAANKDMTCITQRIEENPFLTKDYLDELNRIYSSSYAAQELHAQIIDFSGGIFKSSWFDNREPYFKPEIGVRFWDLAASVKTAADYTVGVKLSKKGDLTYVADCIREKLIWPEAKELIVKTAISDGTGITIGIENVALQLALCQEILSEPRLAMFTIKPVPPQGDKLARALPLAARFEQGIMKLTTGTWNDDFIDEFASFDGQGKLHDDIVDATSGAWKLINRELIFKTIRTDEVMKVSKEHEEAKYLQKIAAVEIKDYKAYIVRAVWNRATEELQIVDENEVTMIEEMVNILKPIPKRVGTNALDSDSYRSIYNSLVQKDCNVVIGGLDQLGTVLWINSLISRNKFYVKRSMNTYSSMISLDNDMEIPPYIKCVLYLSQELRSVKVEPIKELKPFEKQKKEFQQKMREKKISKTGWVG
jgi:predicted phage terminase large subunit-like protein